jgi:hypothetical protein
MRHRSLLDCEQTGRSLIGSQERLLMLTPFHKMTVLTVNTMHQNLLCCGARMAFTQSKHGASRLDVQAPRMFTNPEIANSSTKLTPTQIQNLKQARTKLTPPVFMHLLSALKFPTPHVAWIYV